MMKYLLAASILFAAPAAAQPVVTTQTGTIVPNSGFSEFYVPPPGGGAGLYLVRWSFSEPYSGQLEFQVTTNDNYWNPFTGGYTDTNWTTGWDDFTIGQKGSLYYTVDPGGKIPEFVIYSHHLDYIRFSNDTLDTPYDYKVTVAYAAAVPEASSWAMLILGTGAAGAVLRRRRGEHRQFARA